MGVDSSMTNEIKDYSNSNKTVLSSLEESIKYHLTKTQGLGLKGVLSVKDAVKHEHYLHIYRAVALSVRDKIMDDWIATNKKYKDSDVKQLYYLSAEYLTGRFLGNNLINMDIKNELAESLEQSDIDINMIEDIEMDAGLGNGGLGRLAACFLDSLATRQLPGHGYGLRYDYGIFRQEILDCNQIEHPDQWLQHGNPWEVKHEEDTLIVKFGGQISRENIFNGKEKTELTNCEDVFVVPFDTPILGYKNKTVNTLRLWSTSVPDYNQFDIKSFDRGDYENALKNVLSHEDLTMVSILYPNDNHDSGKRLRLKQQYILVSASMQDIFRNYKNSHKNFDLLHEKIAIQINDTHPSLVITELMRILVDQEDIPWDKAWDITTKTCGYTNHTIMSEALEQWNTDMMREIIPRNYEIIEIINHKFCKSIWEKFPDDMERVRHMSIIENGKVKMAHLAIVGSHSVNGVAQLHTDILKNQTFRYFSDMFPGKFNNKTNGITPRRWIVKPNPELTTLITSKIGNGWITELEQLKKLEDFVDDIDFLNQLTSIKQKNKEALKEYIHKNKPVKDKNGKVIEWIHVDTNSIFVVQAKRIHEYKRQLMNALHILMLYNDLKADPTNREIVPKTFLFAGKSAPGYDMAKSIITFINILARIINKDPDVNGIIKVVFLENYNVSQAQKLLIAADVSEQISTAGFEASGTGNMKLALNGALTIGTMDGANVEMSEEIGAENMFIFGLTTDDIIEIRNKGYNPEEVYNSEDSIKKIINQLWSNELTDIPEEVTVLHRIAESLSRDDRFLVLKDLIPYKNAHQEISELYKDKTAWARKSLLNIARIGKFSSDRTIKQYNDEIWHLKKTEVV